MLLGFRRIFNPIFQPRLPVNFFQLRLTNAADPEQISAGIPSYGTDE
jgi:hypothetical protein